MTQKIGKETKKKKITDREYEMEENGTGKGVVVGKGVECVYDR